MNLRKELARMVRVIEKMPEGGELTIKKRSGQWWLRSSGPLYNPSFDGPDVREVFHAGEDDKK